MAGAISWRLLTEWEAFFEASPQGEDRGDWQASAVCASLYNTRAFAGGKADPMEPADFMAYLQSKLREHGLLDK